MTQLSRLRLGQVAAQFTDQRAGWSQEDRRGYPLECVLRLRVFSWRLRPCVRCSHVLDHLSRVLCRQ